MQQSLYFVAAAVLASAAWWLDYSTDRQPCPAARVVEPLGFDPHQLCAVCDVGHVVGVPESVPLRSRFPGCDHLAHWQINIAPWRLYLWFIVLSRGVAAKRIYDSNGVGIACDGAAGLACFRTVTKLSAVGGTTGLQNDTTTVVCK